MNKAIKYLGFSFFGALLLLVLGAAGPIFIPVQNGAGNATKFTNAVAVSNFFSLDTSGAKTNLEINGGDAAHFYPQTSAQGIITFGDPSLATGLWGLWSKPAGLFMMGNGGTTEFQINMANGTTFINGPQTNNNNIDMNGRIQTWDGAGNKVVFIDNDQAHPRILGTLALELQNSGGGNITLIPGANVVLNNGQFVGNGGGLTNLNPYTSSSVTVFGTAPATNLLLDAAFGNVFRVVLTNNMGILFTNGTDAQVYTVSLFQDTVGTRTIAWVNNTGGTVTNFWNFGTDLPRQSVNLTTNASKLDIVRFTYRTAQAGVPNTTNRIDVIGEIKGF